MATSQEKLAFVEYVELLRQLHVLIDTGLGESSEADAIRDRMDGPWRHLTSEEIAEIDRLSAESRSPKPGTASGDASAILRTVALTSQEVEVLQQIAVGKSNAIIAKSLHVSRETVKDLVQNILRKIAASDKSAKERSATLANP
jgi:DNA-binding NarL/FixJ family response regulator